MSWLAPSLRATELDPPSSSAALSKALIAVVLVAGLYAGSLAQQSHPTVLLDDAAISFRYAERLCQGRGFTYNDHERVLGASNPLYVLVLSLSCLASVPIETAAQIVGHVSYVLIVTMVAFACARLGGALAAAVSGLIIVSDAFFRFQVLGGMEVGFELALAVTVIVAVTYRQFVVAGAMAGLAVWTKLDACALVAALTLTTTWYTKRPPWAFLISFAATLTPWLLWSTWYFGSAIPHSITTKLAGGEGQPFDPLWIIRFLWDPSRRFPLLASVFTIFVVNRRREVLVPATVAVWAAIHGTGYSLIDLGAPYPWYPTALVVPLALLTGLGSGVVARTLRQVGLRQPTVVFGSTLCVAAVVAALWTVPTQWAKAPPRVWELFEADRKAAGVFLRQYAKPNEVLETAYGWPAFESRLPTNDRSGLNSTRSLHPVSYRVEHGYPLDQGGNAPLAPRGMVPLATFDSAHRNDSNFSWFVVFGSTASEATKAVERAHR